MHACIYIHTYIHTDHTYRPYIHTEVHTEVHTYITHTYIHTFVHTYVNTYIHTHIPNLCASRRSECRNIHSFYTGADDHTQTARWVDHFVYAPHDLQIWLHDPQVWLQKGLCMHHHSIYFSHDPLFALDASRAVLIVICWSMTAWPWKETHFFLVFFCKIQFVVVSMCMCVFVIPLHVHVCLCLWFLDIYIHIYIHTSLSILIVCMASIKS